MIGIPLASVVAFLRPRGALVVLEGAPYDPDAVIRTSFPAANHLRSIDYAQEPQDILRMMGHPHPVERALKDYPDARLYLGSGDVCPAAEGWAARVLALAKGYSLTASPYFLHTHDGVVVLLGYDGGEMADLGVWMHPEIRGPAERLAAVLRYEMERAK